MTAEELEKSFRHLGIVRGGLLLLRPVDAVALVEAAKEGGVQVLGADAFRIEEEGTQPLLEHSVDVSDGVLAGADNPWDTLASFVRSHIGNDIFFEIVLRGTSGRV